MRNNNNKIPENSRKTTFGLWILSTFLLILLTFLSVVIYQESQILKRFSPLVISEESLQTKISKDPVEKNPTTKNDVASEAGDSKIPQIAVLELKNHEKAHFEKILEASKNQPDAISYANQLGRLDLVSIAIAMFSVVLGVGAVYGFLYIKDVSKIQAREAADEWLKSPEAERLITKGASKETSKYLQGERFQRLFESAASAENPDEIQKSFQSSVSNQEKDR